jgi:Tfp pilus assembly protein PilV
MRPRLPHPRLDRLRAEDGVSLVEVLVAILLLTVGVVGLLGGFNSARSLTLLSERHTAMAHRAQLEIERLQATPYSELAMVKKPKHSTSEANPDYYVNTAETEYQYSTGEKEPLVISTTAGKIATEPTNRKCSKEIGACEWEDGTLSGNVYDFITWHTDKDCVIKCTESYKRLTVVVTLNVPSGSKEVIPLRVSTFLT